MGTYCYRCPDGTLIEQMYPRGEAPDTVVVNGITAYRDRQVELGALSITVPRRGIAGRSWPMTCPASGVHPRQAGELRELLKKKGCPTEVTPDGDPIYTSPAHRRKALRLRGLHDKNSFD